MSKGLIGSIIVFIILGILITIAYFWKYGFPIVNWLLVLAYVVPSSILFCIHLFLISRGLTNKDDVSSTVYRLESELSKKYNVEIDKAKGIAESLIDIRLSKDRAIREMDDAKEKMMTDIDKRLKENHDSLIDRIGKRMDVIENNLNTKLDCLIDKSKIKGFSQQVETLSNSMKEIGNLKLDLIKTQKEMVDTDKTHQKVIDLIEYILKDIKLNKKKQEEYEETLTRLKMKLSQSKGEEYKQTLAEYNKLKAETNGIETKRLNI